jgi:hypothetical protein
MTTGRLCRGGILLTVAIRAFVFFFRVVVGVTSFGVRG